MIERIDIDDIKENPRNPRKISAENFQKLKDSLKKFPEMQKLRPIIIDEKGFALGGNQRLKALRELGETEAFIIRAENLTAAQKKEFLARDNISLGEWDFAILEEDFEIPELRDFGFTDKEMREAAAFGEAVEDDYAPPDEIKTDIKLGDLIELGPHRLLCGDTTKIDDVMRLMNGNKADMVFTDPPYGMNLDTNYANIYINSIAKVKNQDKIIGDDKDFNFIDFYALFEYVKEQFWWGADYYQNQLPSNGGIFVWDKVCESMEGRIGNEFELCWSKQRHKKEIIHIKWAGFLGLQKEDGKRQHPTQKPIRLCESFISRFSKESNLLIDPFLGSGSTMVAAHQLNRICYGMEISPQYCQVVVNRMKKSFPELPVKINGIAVKVN